MADIQKYFVEFDEAIRYERDEEKATLGEKRERILRKLSEGIKRQRREGQVIPSYEAFNQGSYAMNTGVKPINGDFDIDVGLRFDLPKADYPDPLVVKKWVYDALDGHTNKVELRRSCVTVFYQQEGEDIYHVDLAIYSGAGKNLDSRDYLAKGKTNSASEHRFWEASDPQGLCDCIANRHAGEDRAQFRRIIRTLKRWKDLRFSKDGNAAPRGIALTAAAYHWFRASRQEDLFARVTKYDDLGALRGLVREMLSRFQPVWNGEEGRSYPRLRIELPVSPRADLCEKMSDSQMLDFKTRLEALLASVESAQGDVDPHTACKELAKHLGEDFPVPEKSETAQKRERAITSSGNSA
jgi:hypothetical protein